MTSSSPENSSAGSHEFVNRLVRDPPRGQSLSGDDGQQQRTKHPEPNGDECQEWATGWRHGLGINRSDDEHTLEEPNKGEPGSRKDGDEIIVADGSHHTRSRPPLFHPSVQLEGVSPFWTKKSEFDLIQTSLPLTDPRSLLEVKRATHTAGPGTCRQHFEQIVEGLPRPEGGSGLRKAVGTEGVPGSSHKPPEVVPRTLRPPLLLPSTPPIATALDERSR